MSLTNCRIVLVKTHYPGNLGATARVMRNFGLDDLVLVAPIADKNDRRARRLSTHGENILEQARIVAEFGDAVTDCVLVAGTSARTGGLFRRQNVGTPAEIMPLLVAPMRAGRRVALVFGTEPNGLPDEAVTRCHHLIHIPASGEYPALNLAQAVAICVHELHEAWLLGGAERAPRVETDAAEELATFEAQEHLFRQLQSALEKIHFLYGDKADALMHGLRHLLGKARLTVMETKLLLGLARQICWYAEQKQGQS